MPRGLDHSTLCSQLEIVFKACDQDGKGFLTESCLNSALDQVLPQRDKVEILKILGVLNSSDARVSLALFKQKVVEFLERPSEDDVDSVDCGVEDKENVGGYEEFFSTFSQAQPQVIARRNTFSSLDDSINLKMSPFKPNLNSSFLICESAGCSPPETPPEPLSRLSFMEDTFEGDGEDNETEEAETYSRKNSILQSRSLRFRKHLRSHKYNRTNSSPSFTTERVQHEDEPDRINNNTTGSKLHLKEMSRRQNVDSTSQARNQQMQECLTWERRLLNLKFQSEEDEKLRLQEENEALLRQLNHSELVVKRFEDELSIEGKMVQSLEEKLSFLDSNNKELAHDHENSKYNIKNLEDHLLFMEEKISIDNKELNSEKYMLMQDKEHLNEERVQLEESEKRMKEKLDELDIREDELLSEKHILQLEIASLKRENKHLSDKNESLERTSQEEINKLSLENKALKEKLNNHILRKVDLQFVKELVTSDNKKVPNQNIFKKRNLIKYVVKRLCFHTALRSVYEIFIYLVTDYYS